VQGEAQVLKGALLGCGSISQYHLSAWQQIGGVQITALANRTLERALERGRQFGISAAHIYSDHRLLLEKEDIDFVDVATAPQAHRRQVEDAARAGAHVLCQKPLAPSLEDACAMLDACNRAGVLFSVNENWRWRTWYRQVKSLLQQNTVGKVRQVRICRHASVTLPKPDGSLPDLFIRQAYTRTMERLIVFEWGIHLVDVLRFLFGEVTRMFARLERISPLCAGEDCALLSLEVGGVPCLVDISWASPDTPASASPLEEVLLEGEDGMIELLPGDDLLRVTTAAGHWQRRAYDGTAAEAYQASYTAAQRHFIDCLRAGVLPETEAADNLRTLKAVFAAYDSDAQKRVILL